MKKPENELSRGVTEVLPVTPYVMMYVAEVKKPPKGEEAEREAEVKNEAKPRPAKSYPLL
jgi:hypothetical protein